MEHLQVFNVHHKWSIAGAIVTNLSGVGAVITSSEILVYVSIGTGLITMGYTIDKWYQMRKLVKKGKNPNID